MDHEVEEPRLFTLPASTILVTARWSEGEGWTCSLSSRTHVEGPGVPDEDRDHPSELYTSLTLSELVDVIEAESRLRRGF